jgi:selenide,water dikinase
LKKNSSAWNLGGNMKNEPNRRLTETVRGAGCASKLGPGLLDRALCGLEFLTDPNVIVGLEKPDDAGVYQLREDLAIVQTIDYFTPIVDDPYDFGQVAAANALSDIYAMGGHPITAMNVVCFPSKTMDITILQDILRGGLAKLREAGVVMVGGHSVDDSELKYGLSVTGIVHPEKVVTKTGARPGDRLILTKKLGTGIINTAVKAGMVEEKIVARVTRQMTTLNKKASELMLDVGVHSCTDVTGFGLLGHACEMVVGTDIGMVIHASSVPLLPDVEKYAQMGLIPAGTYRNKEFRSHMIEAAEISDETIIILFDAQTSGGLLMSLPEHEATELLGRMHDEGLEAAIIGEVVAEPKQKIKIA